MRNDGEGLSAENKWAIIGIALLQGLLLFTLHDTMELLAVSPVWLYPAYTLLLALPLLAIICIGPRMSPWFYGVLTVYGLLLVSLGLYRGQQCSPADAVRCIPVAYVLCATIATFVLAVFLRACTADGEHLRSPEYSALFHFSWDNALAVKLSAVFVGIFFLILALWAGIFALVGIKLFAKMFTQPWFIYPAGATAFGAGLVLFRSQQSFVLTLKRLLRTLLVALLPLLALLTVLFLATLPFTGLEPIWSTDHGSALMLWLVALLLFFTNGVVQDEFPFSRYPKLLNRLLLLALVAAPVYCAIAVYGLSLRVHQYGWTPQRLWGITVALTLTLLSLAYCAAILRRGEHWATQLRGINTGLALWVLAICLLTQSPLLDFWKISARDQLARLQSGEVEMRDTDLTFLRRELGRPGYLALRELHRSQQASDPQLAERMDQLFEKGFMPSKARPEPSLYRLPVIPAGASLPVGLNPTRFDSHNRCGGQQPKCFWLLQDLDDDDRDELLLFSLKYKSLQISSWTEVDHDWRSIGVNSQRFSDSNFDDLRRRVEKREYRLAPTRWQSLQLDDETLFDPTR